jgi:membrane protein YqaA with SNARE-associated domain
MEALLALFGASFVAATLFPLPSEAALFAYLRAYPDHAVLAVLLYRLFSYWLPLPAGLVASILFRRRHRLA